MRRDFPAGLRACHDDAAIASRSRSPRVIKPEREV
jgi:hypothetical protein